MNEKSKMIYDYVRDVASYAGTPSVRDICTALGIKSPSTVHRYLNELEKEGLITRSNDKHRYISLTQDKAVLVPIYGTIPAGRSPLWKISTGMCRYPISGEKRASSLR